MLQLYIFVLQNIHLESHHIYLHGIDLSQLEKRLCPGNKIEKNVHFACVV